MSSGDWNHSLVGREYAGSRRGAAALARAVVSWLRVPTIGLRHRREGMFGIDHVAVPGPVLGRRWVSAVGLSDHDAYVVDVELGG